MISMRALIDLRGFFNPAAAYYRMFSFDQTYYGDNIVVEPRRVTRVRFNSIASLLQALVRFGRNGENRFLIVSHGNPNGLPLHVVTGNSATMTVEFMNNLAEAVDGRAEGRRFAMSFADNSGRHVFHNERQLDELLRLIRDVRQLRLEHLEFRGCNLGAGPALRAMHGLLGSRLTAAPRVQFIWSRLATAGVHGTSAWLRNQIGRLPPVRRLFNSVDCLRGSAADPDDEVVFALALQGEGHRAGFRLLARDSDVIHGWTQSYLQPLIYFAASRVPPGGGYRRGGFLPVIGFSTPHDAEYPFVFPGDAFRYTQQIAYEIESTR